MCPRYLFFIIRSYLIMESRNHFEKNKTKQKKKRHSLEEKDNQYKNYEDHDFKCFHLKLSN